MNYKCEIFLRTENDSRWISEIAQYSSFQMRADEISFILDIQNV